MYTHTHFHCFCHINAHTYTHSLTYMHTCPLPSLWAPPPLCIMKESHILLKTTLVTDDARLWWGGGCSLCVYCILMNKGQCLRSDYSEVSLVDAFVMLIFLLEVVCCSNLCYCFNCRWNKWNHIPKILPFHLHLTLLCASLEEEVAPKWMFRLFRFSIIKVPYGLSERQNKKNHTP